ncbi:MAG: chromosomal replication initiator protein DnaA [Desulfobulbus propionicus]|nr:MAG: chromosomal replication initiator protein DnaA [Desulfobulbus propionicus]
MVWDSIKSSLLASLSESEFSLWIKPLECRHQGKQSLELYGPDRFFCAYVEQKYLGLITDIIQSMKLDLSVRFIVSDKTPVIMDSNISGQMRLPGTTAPAPRFRSLHPAYTFDQFMVGRSNVLAQSACSALAKGERTFGTCLFMSSSTGLGKSHLTQAVVHSIFNSAPSTRLQYLTAQQFSAEMVQNLRTRSMEQFSKKYINSCDILLIEDIHTLTGKNKTQEELNTILDYLIKSGRRVILTSAVQPNKLQGLDTDFLSRMTSGLVTDIQSPDYETRVRIIRHKLRVNQVRMEDNLVDYLAQTLKGDVRRIESAILGIKAKCCLRGEAPSMDVVKEVVSRFVCTENNLSSSSILDFVGDQFNVSVEDLKSRSRKRSISHPRQVAMYLSRKFTKESLADIGGIYNRDHSTVLHAIKVITKEMARQGSTREQIELLSSRLQQ